MDIQIYGSCVSRDILEFDTFNSLNLQSYRSRSSIGTLAIDNVSTLIPNSYYDSLKKIKSKFQHRMVNSDFKNNVLNSIDNANYDLLLIDLIDERFHLAEISGKIITQSEDFLRSGIKPDKIIDTFSDEYLNIWYKGVDNLFSTIDAKIGLDAVKINKVYWADSATNLQDTIKLRKKWSIEKNNEKLNVMYDYIESMLPASSIIHVPKSLLVADSEHKWGLAPFHYINDYYETMLNTLKAL
ncbi:DUF6270 domain-containing protein [Psychrobacter sp. SIMBA_152]